MKLYLQNILADISFDSLPVKWQNFDLAKFSKDKTLYDFQKQGLEHALKALHLFYKENKGKKEEFYKIYEANGYEEKFDYDLEKKKDGKTIKYLLEYDKDYFVVDDKISFSHFINRMSFWMATGSGKTLILVKLINLLGQLASKKEIPQKDILFLAHRDDLLAQFKKHVDEFNSHNFDTRINLKSLKEYESVKRENALPFSKNEITVFYYRSDLISDEHKETIVDFRNYDNNGQWYILLDEAHKGDKEDSKRQMLYSVLSRNGFLFNFSATFTDPRDYATCAFNFNLSRFIEEGYGKHIFVSEQEVTAFRDEDDFSTIEKQKIVLKTLLLQTYINKYFAKIKKKEKKLYHRPLLLTLVNSVDTKEADLKLFFAELEKVAKREIRVSLFSDAKEELMSEFAQARKYVFENTEVAIDKNTFSKIKYEDILESVFNSKQAGNIEALKIPGNKNEIIFKLQTSEKPFALIKIGDISGWLKDTLGGYEIIESFENESVFKKINRDDSEINILMGSRAFYEGWDSNRPNLLLFINIGVGKDAKKFVLQSVGRGVRIEPLKNKRKRLVNLYNAKEISEKIFTNARPLMLPIESLFIFGTNAENLKEIIKRLKEEKQDRDIGQAFIVNAEASKHILLVPVYKKSEKIFAEVEEIQKFSVNQDDYKSTKRLLDYLAEKVALAKYECEAKVLLKVSDSIKSENEERYFDLNETRSIDEPALLLGRLFDYFSIEDREFDKFKKLEDEIVHFKKIKFTDGDKYEELMQKLEKIKTLPQKQKELYKQYGKIPREEFARKQMSLFGSSEFEIEDQRIKIKYLTNHYYHPIIVSEQEKVDYLNHIIDVESEINFVEELEAYLQTDDNIFKNYDWWMFSKLDQTLDQVYIPYYSPRKNNMARFLPDFIFWLKRGNEYTIVFIDPKGTEHTDGLRKIDGYSKIFETNDNTKKSKKYPFNGFDIETKLLLKSKRGIAEVPENYRGYWFDNFQDFAKKLIL
ncbi:MAG: DEAD/DEAH box helicase family protein [Patescibacteria group bacterium]|nr:DEAD/DEAH box helicase family protein [Patescibacteria group bacterium]